MKLGFDSIINKLEFLYKLHEQNDCLADCIYLTQGEYNCLTKEFEDIKLYRKWEYNEFLYNLVTVHRRYHNLNLVISEG